jgi:hypothetical protein
VSIARGTHVIALVNMRVHPYIDCLEEEKPANTEENTEEKHANTDTNTDVNTDATTKLKDENITDVNIKEKLVVINYHNYQLCFIINIID